MKKAARPRPVLTRTPVMRVCDVLTVIVIVATLLFVLHAWSELPDRIAVHFNVEGVPDGWGSKGALLSGPIFGAVMAILLTILSRYPHRFNYIQRITEQNAQQHYTLIRETMAVVCLVFAMLGAFISWLQVSAAYAGTSPKSHTVLLVVFALVGPQAVFITYLVRASRIDSTPSSATRR